VETAQAAQDWSAGCATGEEPYSIAIALKRVISGLSDWHITILATDITPEYCVKRRPAFTAIGHFAMRRYGLKRIISVLWRMVNLKSSGDPENGDL